MKNTEQKPKPERKHRSTWEPPIFGDCSKKSSYYKYKDFCREHGIRITICAPDTEHLYAYRLWCWRNGKNAIAGGVLDLEKALERANKTFMQWEAEYMDMLDGTITTEEYDKVQPPNWTIGEEPHT